jgi:hypothetical protein
MGGSGGNSGGGDERDHVYEHERDHVHERVENAGPPFLGRWGNVYALVIGALVVEIVGLAVLSWMYR